MGGRKGRCEVDMREREVIHDRKYIKATTVILICTNCIANLDSENCQKAKLPHFLYRQKIIHNKLF